MTPGIPPVPSYHRIIAGILRVEVTGSRRVRVFRCLYKRLEKVTNSTWLFILSGIVSAQLFGQRDSNIQLHLALSRSATP
jgi:hypothetical protein